jgi:hypothetical protein
MAMTPMADLAELIDSRDHAADGPALRARARRDGYLFVRGLIPRWDVERMRQAVLEVAGQHGWLDPSVPLDEGRARPGMNPVIEGEGERWDSFYRDLYRRRELHAFNQHPAIMSLFARFFDGPVLAHPRVIARVMFPRCTQHSTPPHQDHFYIGGTLNTWTAWIPLGDCPGQLGGLAVAAGSHAHGSLAVHRADGAGGHAVDYRGSSWHSTDYEAGDLLVFHSQTVHQARDNRSGNRLRLSMDLRYQLLQEPVRRDSLLPHRSGTDFDWRQVYEHWDTNDPLRGYWDRLSLDVIS